MKLDGQRVQQARERLGYSLETTAVEAGVAKNSVLRAEHEGDIRPVTARKIAAALDVKVADLLPLAQAPLPFEENQSSPTPDKAQEEERRDEELAVRLLLANVAKQGEQLEEQLRTAEGDPVLAAILGPYGSFPENAIALHTLYDRAVREGGVSEEVRKRKHRLDAVSARIEGLLNQAFSRLPREQRQEIQRFRRRAAEALREQQEGVGDVGVEAEVS